MIKKTLAALAVSSAAALGHAQEQGPLTIPGSLFNQLAGDGVINNHSALHKGDLITVVVNEQSAGSTSSTLTATKQDSTTVNPINVPILSSILRALPGQAQNGAGVGASSSIAGAGAANTTTSFTSNVTVTVKDVLPNGNLVIQGKRSLKMNKQTQEILLEGTVRRDDILNDNTVLSSKISDLRLVAEGKGLIADRQRQGILTKLLSWVF